VVGYRRLICLWIINNSSNTWADVATMLVGTTCIVSEPDCTDSMVTINRQVYVGHTARDYWYPRVPLL